MKKSLLALAALSAFATAAQAQSNVTVYGIADLSWQSVDNDAGQTAGTLVRNALASSRLGFRGTEDLGGGLKANFQLEAALNLANGQAGTTQTTTADALSNDAATTFDRAAWVGLSSEKFGELRVGRQDVTAANDIDVMVSQMGNMGLFGMDKDQGMSKAQIGDNANQAVVYISPAFNGFQLQAGYATANTQVSASSTSTSAGTTTEATTGDVTSYMLSYAQGPLKVYAAKQEEKKDAAADNLEETILGASYDAGVASFGVAYQDSNAGTSKEVKQTIYTVAVPVPALGSGVKLHAGYLVFNNKTLADADITTTRFAVTKALSKRTTIYAAYSSADHDNAAKNNAGLTVTTMAVGVAHSF
jgi:predicted porin